MIAAVPLRLIADGVLSVVWAPCCATCDISLDTPTRGVVCTTCWQQVHLITPPVCDTCGAPISAASIRDERCPHCPEPAAHAKAITHQRAAGWYEGTLRSIIHAFKYQGRRSLAKPLAALMRETGRDLLDSIDFVVPVPLHPRRRWERGFHQARELAEQLGPPVVNALRRTRPTQPQTTLTVGRRHWNVHGAFDLRARRSALTARASLVGKTIVLVDDVMTTGATLNACANVLRASGARELRGLTVARVSARPPWRSPPPHLTPAPRRPRAPNVAAEPAAGSSL